MNTENDRHEDYLWDRSGPPDERIVRLERLLAPYAWRGGDLKLRKRIMPTHRRGRRVLVLAAAVLCLFVLAGGWYWQRLQWPASRPWKTVAVAGMVHLDGKAVRGEAVLSPGARLQTGDDGVARVEVARIGTLWVGPGSRLRLLETRGGHHRVRLASGTVWARLWAPPGSFGVDLDTLTALDLGCEFMLSVDAAGNGRLAVRRGWVEIGSPGDEVLVPQGAQVDLRHADPPGTPYVSGARSAFISALHEVDAQGAAVDPRSDAVRRLVAAARPQDAITLVSLLTRYPALRESAVFDYAKTILPPGVSHATLRARGRAALDPWWHALPYPRIKHWWLEWPDAFGAASDMPAALHGQVR